MNSVLSLIIFALIFAGIVGSVHVYLWFRLIRNSSLPSPWRRGLTVVLVLLFLSLPSAMFLTRGLPFSIASYLNVGPYIWMGIMMLFFFWFLAADVVRLLVYLSGRLRRKESYLADPTRRLALGRILAGSGALVVGGMSTAAVAGAKRPVQIKKLKVMLKQFPAAMNGFKIVQISDLHLGNTVGRQWLAQLVRRVNALEPDIVAVTGDLLDGFVDNIGGEIAPLAELKAKNGVYFVTGNHEYYSNVEEWLPVIRKLGVRVLRNEHVEIGHGPQKFTLAGVDDYEAARIASGHGQDVPRALEGRNPNNEVVLLAHQPRAVYDAAKHGVGLVLAGHTHGGQIWPFTYLVALQQPYLKGLYQHDNTTQIYVNQGTGLWGPQMRLGTESEITELSLYRGSFQG